MLWTELLGGIHHHRCGQPVTRQLGLELLHLLLGHLPPPAQQVQVYRPPALRLHNPPHHGTVRAVCGEDSPVELEAFAHVKGEGASLHRDVVAQVLASIIKAIDLGVDVGGVTGIAEEHSDAVSEP